MPNWTYNVVKMNGIAKKSELFSVDSNGNKYFDFNKIIPEPKDEAECRQKYGEEYIDHGDAHLCHTEEDKWFNWYHWHIKFWGTKWNCCDTEIDNDDSVSFMTAWTEPEPIFIALSKKYPKEEIHIWAEYEEGTRTESIYLNGNLLSYKEEMEEDKNWVFYMDENNFKTIVFEGTTEECEAYIEEMGGYINNGEDELELWN